MAHQHCCLGIYALQWLTNHINNQQNEALVKLPLQFVNTEALPHGICSNPSPAAVKMAA